MGPDRIRAWLARVPKAAGRIELVFEQLGIRYVVSSWSKDELASTDGAVLIVDAAQEHCDDLAAPAKYQLQWVDDNGRPLSTKPMRLEPAESEPRMGGNVEDSTVAGMLGQALRHNEVMARLYVGAQGGILNNMQQVLKLQADTIAALQGELKAANARARAAERQQGEVAQESEESIARAQAITKVGEAVASHLIPLAAAHFAAHANGVQQ